MWHNRNPAWGTMMKNSQHCWIHRESHVVSSLQRWDLPWELHEVGFKAFWDLQDDEWCP